MKISFFLFSFLFFAVAWSQPANDDCIGATPLSVASTCGNISGTTANATPSTASAPPCGGATANEDVWYSFTATTPFTNITMSNVQDPVGSANSMNFVVYTGTCGALTDVMCSTANSDVIPTTNGQTYYVRVFNSTYNEGEVTTYDICAISTNSATCGTPANNDYCAAPALLTEGGSDFSASTYGQFSSDLPGDFSSVFCGGSGVTVENNSWYSFVANSSTETFDFSVTNCDNDLYGLQAEVLQVTHDANGCCTGFTSVSDCEDGSGEGTFSLSANGLTPGQTYYLAVDGYEGAHCDFTVTGWSATGVLGVQLTDFYGIGFDNGNRIYWRTKSETESNYFEVLRSFDGKKFEVIGKLWGAGTSNFEHNYEYFDKNMRNGVCYYKLKQVDFNGKIQYAGPIQINRTAHGYGIVAIYPNPAENQIFVEINVGIKHSNDLASVALIGVDGKVLQSIGIDDEGFHQVQFDLSRLEKGIYFIRYSSNSTLVSTKRFIKK